MAQTTLAERWDGSTWSLQGTPNVAAFNQLSGVSCPSENACIAVGNSLVDPDSNYKSLAERWNGKASTVEPTPNAQPVSQIGGTYIDGVACASSKMCVAVGNDQDNDPLVERLGAAPPPSNRFAVSDIKTFVDGAVNLRVRIPGPGRIDVLETAWNDNYARVAPLLQPAPRRFVFGRTRTSAHGHGTFFIRVIPKKRGTLLVGHHRYRVTLRLWVSYTPTGGRMRSIGFYGLHLP